MAKRSAWAGKARSAPSRSLLNSESRRTISSVALRHSAQTFESFEEWLEAEMLQEREPCPHVERQRDEYVEDVALREIRQPHRYTPPADDPRPGLGRLHSITPNRSGPLVSSVLSVANSAERVSRGC